MFEYKVFSATQRRSDFQELHNYAIEHVSQLREAYDRKLEIESESLSLMLALDAGLLSDILVEYAARDYPVKQCHYDDYVVPRRHFCHILRDLVLMENQIPMHLVSKAMGDTRLHELPAAVSKVVSYIYPFEPANLRLPPIDFHACHHLLDYLYQICTHKSETDDPKAKTQDVQIPTATQLRAAGISFSPANGGLSKIQFVKATATLCLPVLKIQSETESCFRNLIAYEQCRSDLSVHWCSYMRLMRYLICKPEDVEVLAEQQVLENRMGANEAVAELWNKLGVNEELCLTSRDEQMMEKINEYWTSKWKPRKWAAAVRHRYFSRRWSFILAVAAALLLTMIFLQTTFTMFQYWHPPNHGI